LGNGTRLPAGRRLRKSATYGFEVAEILSFLPCGRNFVRADNGHLGSWKFEAGFRFFKVCAFAER
jgi:hypothetical protein